MRHLIGTIDANDESVTLETDGLEAVHGSISGTWVGDLTPEASWNGTSFGAVHFLDIPNKRFHDKSVINRSAILVYPVIGARLVRIRSTAWTSGSATVVLVAHKMDSRLSPWNTPYDMSVETAGNTGTVTAPGAGAAIVTVAAPVQGEYEIRVRASYGGTADVINNMELRKGTTVISDLLVPALVNLMPPEQIFPHIILNGTDAVTVNAIAAGAASTVYNAQLIVTKLQ